MPQRERIVFENGLEVLLEPRPIGESAAYLIINAGSRHDKMAETAHVIEHLQGVAAKVYGESGDLNYASSNAVTYQQHTVYHFDCVLPQDLPLVISNLAHAFDLPDHTILERERKAVRNELQPQVTPHQIFVRQIHELLVPETSKVLTKIDERLTSLDNITIKEINKFWNHHYDVSNSILYVSGEIQDIKNLLMPFANMRTRNTKTSKMTWPHEEPLQKRIKIAAKISQNKTGSVQFSYQIPKLAIAQETALFALCSYLNRDNGPLYRTLRDQRNLCYSLNVNVEHVGGEMEIFYFYAPTEAVNVKIVEHCWLDALSAIAEQGVPKNFIQTYKKGMLIHLLHQSRHFDFKALQQELLYDTTIEDRQRAVELLTVEDIARTARDVLNLNYVVSIALPATPP